jgi:H+-transporting ATPase
MTSPRTDTPIGLSAGEAAQRLRERGPNDVPEKRPHSLRTFLGKFWGLSAWMLEVMAALSLVLHKRTDLVIVLALLVLNAVVSFLEEHNASTAVAVLRNRLRVTSRVLRDARWSEVPARDLVVDDVVRVRRGDFIPADARLLDGEIQVDQSTLTGESQAVARKTGDVVYSGSTVRQGEATAVVTATGATTYFGRTTVLVESARPQLHVETVVARIVRWLLVIVGVQVAVVVAGAAIERLSLTDVVPLALVLLLGAIPVALPVMFTVSMAVGARELSRLGVLVTRLSAAEDAASMDVVCADKTGTLTMNRLDLVRVLAETGFSEDDVIRDGALASHEADQDAIDLAFLRAARQQHLMSPDAVVRRFTPFSPETRRTEALVEQDGRHIRVMKGAVRSVGALVGLPDAALSELEARAEAEARHGLRTLAVARADGDGPLRFAGLAFLADPLRPDSLDLLEKLRSLGVTVRMLTGDALPVAAAIAKQLGVEPVVPARDLFGASGNAGDVARIDAVAGIAEIYPEDKFHVVEALQRAGHVVGMTGDGVNDAPALRQAEVGIAVCSATDVAKGAASVVLTSDGLGGIIDLVTQGRAVYQRVLTWVINKVNQTILKTGFVVIAFLVTGRFVVSALTMLLLIFMTDFVKISLATDRVRPSRAPERWNIAPLIVLAIVLGIVMLAESLGVLALGWRWFDLGAAAGRSATFAFLVLLFFALFSLVSIRERRAFWTSMPSRTLGVALCADAVVGTWIGLHGLGELAPLTPAPVAFIVGSAAACTLLLNDVIKRAIIARAPSRPGASKTG